jgi:hypothetical protein
MKLTSKGLSKHGPGCNSFTDVTRNVLRIHSQVQSKRILRVQIYQQNTHLMLCQCNRNVGCQSGLANPSLSGDECDYLHGQCILKGL